MIKKLSNISLVGMVFLSMMACNNFKSADSPMLAEVGSKKLFLNDISSFVPSNVTTQEDSIAYLNVEVEEWVRNQVLLERANLSKKTLMEIEALVKDYRSNLTRSFIEKSWVESHLDTVVSQDSIEAFRESNKDLFVMDHELIKCTFAKIDAGVDGLIKLDEEWKSGQMDKVISFCNTFAKNKHLEKESWVSLSQIKRQIPKDLFTDDNFTKKGYYQKSRNNFEYFLKVEDYKKKGDMPISVASKKIKKIIIQQRKLELLKSYKESLYQEAINKNQIKLNLDKVK